jgi:hypothetical protein
MVSSKVLQIIFAHPVYISTLFLCTFDTGPDIPLNSSPMFRQPASFGE